MKKLPERGAFLVLGMFKKVAGLTVESLAYSVHGLEAYALHLACFQVGKIDVGHAHLFGKLIEGHLPVCHHLVKSDYYSHAAPPLRNKVVVFLKAETVDEDFGYNADYYAYSEQK